MVDNPVIFFSKADFLILDKKDINLLKNYASQSLSKRARYCLHHSCEDNIQEMIIAFHKDSYVRPHKHLNKTESFHVIEGEMFVCFFDDAGKVTEKIFLSAFNRSKAFFYRLSIDKWHCVVPISNYAVIHEVTKGPYNLQDTVYPPWAPQNMEKENIIRFLKELEK